MPIIYNSNTIDHYYTVIKAQSLCLCYSQLSIHSTGYFVDKYRNISLGTVHLLRNHWEEKWLWLITLIVISLWAIGGGFLFEKKVDDGGRGFGKKRRQHNAYIIFSLRIGHNSNNWSLIYHRIIRDVSTLNCNILWTKLCKRSGNFFR